MVCKVILLDGSDVGIDVPVSIFCCFSLSVNSLVVDKVGFSEKNRKYQLPVSIKKELTRWVNRYGEFVVFLLPSVAGKGRPCKLLI